MTRFSLANRAVFIDRDGTIARDVPYCSRPEDFQLITGVTESIRKLNDAGYKVVVITNQSGIARGYFTEDMLHKIHQKMKSDLNLGHAYVDGIYYCPHHPDAKCNCRKPRTALFEKAIAEMSIDVSHSFMVGDMSPDIEAGKQIGCKTVFVTSGVAKLCDLKVVPDHIAPNFREAIEWILGN